MKVGLIGLGRMGQGIAGRILEAGHDLAVYNRTIARAAALGDAGARVAGSIDEVCQGREVVITMLADDAALSAVVFGADGLLAAVPAGAIHMAMGTHSVALMRRLATAHTEAGQVFLAVPVLGRPDVAAAGQLGLVPAGPAAALARCRPLFDVIGRRCFEAGSDPEAAAAIKLANNFVLGCAIEVVGEAVSLVRKYGVTAPLLHEVLTEGLFNCPAYKIYGAIIAEEDYDRVGITATLGLKDANLAMQAADAVRVPLPSGNAWRDRLLGAIAHGDGDKDWSVVAREQARASGLE
jgi:3-hydroxyisobutyrate dehydrogenase-like beta-hydroxyacid dehydrogenase